jgi:hypothetical protein
MLFFTFYGFALSCLVGKASTIVRSSNKRYSTHAGRIARVAALYSFCFLLRAIAFAYRIITSGCMLPDWFFWTVGYYIPELITCGHLFWSYFGIDQAARRDHADTIKRIQQGGAYGQKQSSPSASDGSLRQKGSASKTFPEDAASPLLGSANHGEPASSVLDTNAFIYPAYDDDDDDDDVAHGLVHDSTDMLPPASDIPRSSETFSNELVSHV